MSKCVKESVNYSFFSHFLGFSSFLVCGYPLRRGGLAHLWWQPSLVIKKTLPFTSLCSPMLIETLHTQLLDRAHDLRYLTIQLNFQNALSQLPLFTEAFPLFTTTNLLFSAFTRSFLVSSTHTLSRCLYLVPTLSYRSRESIGKMADRLYITGTRTTSH